MYIHIYIHNNYVYGYVHTYIRTHIHKYTHTCAYTDTYAQTNRHTHTHQTVLCHSNFLQFLLLQIYAFKKCSQASITCTQTQGVIFAHIKPHPPASCNFIGFTFNTLWLNSKACVSGSRSIIPLSNHWNANCTQWKKPIIHLFIPKFIA